MYLQKNFNYLKFREVVLKLADFFQVSLDEFVKKDLTRMSERMYQ